MKREHNPAVMAYRLVRNAIMVRGGLQPRGIYWWSKDGNTFQPASEPQLKMPNLVGSFNEALRCFWNLHGFGSRCLLVSESRKTAEAMGKHYPATQFISCDLFFDLMGKQPGDRPEVIWDVCTDLPSDLRPRAFNSVVCNALLEHVIAPTTAIKNFITLLAPGGHLYLYTHTPSYVKHQFPRDYVRFHHDYFEDMPGYLKKVYGLSCELLEVYSCEGTICVCYRTVS